jgi:hypothetical protein
MGSVAAAGNKRILIKEEVSENHAPGRDNCICEPSDADELMERVEELI